MNVRLAEKTDLERVNVLRRQVNDLHVAGRPDIFKPGFPKELSDYIYVIRDDPEKEIVVAESEGTVCGYAVLHRVRRPETPFMAAREYLDIDEFGVDPAFRRQGAAAAMVGYIRDFALRLGVRRVELNMWEFNRDALAFYTAAGFRTYRRYLEMEIGEETE